MNGDGKSAAAQQQEGKAPELARVAVTPVVTSQLDSHQYFPPVVELRAAATYRQERENPLKSRKAHTTPAYCYQLWPNSTTQPFGNPVRRTGELRRATGSSTTKGGSLQAPLKYSATAATVTAISLHMALNAIYIF